MKNEVLTPFDARTEGERALEEAIRKAQRDLIPLANELLRHSLNPELTLALPGGLTARISRQAK